MIQSTFRRVEKQYSDIDLKYWLIIRKSYGEAMSFFNLMIHLGCIRKKVYKQFILIKYNVRKD